MALRGIVPRISAACTFMSSRLENITPTIIGAHFTAKTDPSPKCNSAINYITKFHIHSSATISNKFIINIQDEDDFQKNVLESKVPVIIDFHAE